MKPTFKPGKNIAMKIPAHEFDNTIVFYRDILGLEQTDVSSSDGIESVTFQFGGKVLWLDSITSISQAEIWLEIVTDDIEAAAQYLEGRNCIRRDDIEPLPDGFKGFWLSNPANIIHLVNEKSHT